MNKGEVPKDPRFVIIRVVDNNWIQKVRWEEEKRVEQEFQNRDYVSSIIIALKSERRK